MAVKHKICSRCGMLLEINKLSRIPMSYAGPLPVSIKQTVNYLLGVSFLFFVLFFLLHFFHFQAHSCPPLSSSTWPNRVGWDGEDTIIYHECAVWKEEKYGWNIIMTGGFLVYTCSKSILLYLPKSPIVLTAHPLM